MPDKLLLIDTNIHISSYTNIYRKPIAFRTLFNEFDTSISRKVKPRNCFHLIRSLSLFCQIPVAPLSSKSWKNQQSISRLLSLESGFPPTLSFEIDEQETNLYAVVVGASLLRIVRNSRWRAQYIRFNKTVVQFAWPAV